MTVPVPAHRRAPLALALLVLATAAAADVGPSPKALLERAKKELDRGQLDSAIATLEETLTTLRATAPLKVRRLEVVEAPPSGLGHYEPAPGGRVRGRTVLLYVEVENARATLGADGKYATALDVKGAFSFGGEAIGERALGTHRDLSRARSGVLAFGLDFALSEKAPEGAYEIVVTVTDQHGGGAASQKATFVLPAAAR